MASGLDSERAPALISAQPRTRLCTLMRRQLRRPTKHHATRLGSRYPLRAVPVLEPQHATHAYR